MTQPVRKDEAGYYLLINAKNIFPAEYFRMA